MDALIGTDGNVKEVRRDREGGAAAHTRGACRFRASAARRDGEGWLSLQAVGFGLWT